MNKSFYDFSKLKASENSSGQNYQNTRHSQNSQSENYAQNENSQQRTRESGSQQKYQSTQNSQDTENQNQNSDSQYSQTKNIEDTINRYKDMSQDDLMSNLLNEVSKQKQQGTFDVAKLENAISSFSSFLTPQQQKNMKELLNKIK